jgi:hypothetical protein
MQPQSVEQAAFWRWFRANGDRTLGCVMSSDEETRERASDEVHEALAQALPGVVFAFGGQIDGEYKEFVISADGKRELFDAVKAFVAAAPDIPGWKIVAFRPRIELSSSFAIRIEDEEIAPDDIWFSHAEDGLDLTLYIRDLNEDNRRFREMAALIFLDHALGEHDALTVVHSLAAEPLPDDPAAAGLLPFTELPAFVDAYKQEHYPPPGLLPLEEEGNWAALRGSIDDAPATVLLNMDLLPFIGHPAYDRSVLVSVPFNGVDEEGMPDTEEELVQTQQIGDQFSDALLEGQQSVLAAIVLNNGRRDLIYFTSDADAALARAEEVRVGVISHEVEVMSNYDTFWDAYRGFAEAMDSEGEEEV